MTTGTGFERAFEGWHLCPDFYGEIRCVEASFRTNERNMYIGVGLNIGFEGNYQFRIQSLPEKDRKQFRLLLILRRSSNEVLRQIDCDLEDPAGGVSLRLCLENGLLTGFVNGEKRIEADLGGSPRFGVGYGGVWIHPENSAEFSDFLVDGVAQALPRKAPTAPAEKLVYNLRLRPGELPFGWSSPPSSPAWSADENGMVSPESGEIFLHVFEKDPVFTARFSVVQLKSSASFGFTVRHAPDTAFLKIGYQEESKRWFVQDTPALYDCEIKTFTSAPFSLETGREYEIAVTAKADRVELAVNGEVLLSARDVRHTGFGRIGVFSEGTILRISGFHLEAPNAAPVQDGVVKYVITDPDTTAASMQIVETKDGSLVGVRKILPEKSLNGAGSDQPIDPKHPESRGIFFSSDGGLHFRDLPFGGEYAGLCTDGCYQSVLRRKNGTYLQVLIAKGLEVQSSPDLIHWETVGHVLPEGDDVIAFFHTQSLAEYTLPDGTDRIFLPVVRRRVRKSGAGKIGNNTRVYYSDDGGRSWLPSETDTDTLIQNTSDLLLPDFAECKVVMCGDHTLRLYDTRNDSRFVCYSESFDFGKTWQGIYAIRQMQCAKSSSAFCEDPYAPGTFYMVWVNSLPFSRGHTGERTRLSLARSNDGKSWSFLCDVERMSLRYPDHITGLRSPLFQLVDPSVAVTKEYVLVTCGTVLFAAKGPLLPGAGRAVHHEQRTMVVRLKKSELRAQPWNAATVCDLSLLDEKRGDWL